MESNTWEKKKDLKNAKKLVDDFEGRMRAEVRRQVGERKAEEKRHRRMELPGKYTAKLLYGWNDGEFETEYLRKLGMNWKKWKTLKRGVMSGSKKVDLVSSHLFLFFYFLFNLFFLFSIFST